MIGHGRIGRILLILLKLKLLIFLTYNQIICNYNQIMIVLVTFQLVPFSFQQNIVRTKIDCMNFNSRYILDTRVSTLRL